MLLGISQRLKTEILVSSTLLVLVHLEDNLLTMEL